MRVSFVSYHTSPRDQPGAGEAGGMNVYVDRLARALAGRGVDVDVFTRAPREGTIEEVASGVRVIGLPAGPPGPSSTGQLTPHAAAFGQAIARFACAGRSHYDLVHSHYWLSGVAAMPLARHWHAPLVHTHHTLAELKNATLPAGVAPEPDERVNAERRVVAAAALVTASTEDERARLRAPHVLTLPPGVDHSVFRPGRRTLSEQPALLAAGRIQPLKGLELVIRALPLVPGAPVLLVAGGPSGPDGELELVRLQALSRELGVERRVRFLGPRPQEALADLYRAADVLAVCSHSETFGLSALEAHACGTPIVGTAVGGLPTFVREGRSGFLLEGRDPVLFADRVARVLEGGDAFRDAAVASAASFSWEATADALLEAYALLTQRKMRRNASPYAYPARRPTAADRLLNHSSNCT